MGKVFTKRKSTQVTTKIGREFNCPFCNILFFASTNYNQLNAHIISCAQNTHRVIINDTINAINVREENFNNKNDSLYHEHKINTNVENYTFNANSVKQNQFQTLQKPIDQKKYYSVKSTKNKNRSPKMNFETKIINFRNSLQARKIDWRDAYCKIEISRENLLDESIKKFKLIDPLKV